MENPEPSGISIGLKEEKKDDWSLLLRCGKLDYCNSLYHNLPKSQITRLQHQQTQNSLARAVIKAPKFSHTTPILRSLHWLKVTDRIEYKLLSLRLLRN